MAFSMREISLTRGYVTIVDDADYEELSAFKWRTQGPMGKAGLVYAVRGIPDNGCIYMHRAITNCIVGMKVDHINGNGLDNRRANLRICTHAENIVRSNTAPSINPTGYRGVYKHQKAETYMARLGKTRLGQFRLADTAARAYDAAAREKYGDFAVLNFPGEISEMPPAEDGRLESYLRRTRDNAGKFA